MNFNGVISFGTKGFRDFYARSFPFQSPPLITPFWDDISSLLWEGLYYRQTNDSDLLEQFYNYSLLLRDGDSNTKLLHDYYPTHLFIATWDKVPQWGYLYQEVHII